MAATSLSRQEIRFLEKNFIVYDPTTKESSKADFTSILGARVVLVGEMHFSTRMQEAQQKLLEILCRSMNPEITNCLLLEGLKAGVPIDGKKLPFYRDLPPNLIVHGSETRPIPMQVEADEFLSFMEMKKTTNELGLQFKEECRNIIRELANQMNRIASTAALKKTTDDIPSLISEDDFDLLNPILLRLKQCKEKTIDSLMALKTYNCGKKDYDHQIMESNRGLAKCIKKESKTHHKIIAIWGMDHFYLGKELVHILSLKGLSPLILIPNKRITKKADKQTSWGRHHYPTAKIKFNRADSADSESIICSQVSIPKRFKSYFTLGAQKYFRIKSDSSYCFDVKTFNSRVRESPLEIPARNTIKLKGFEIEDYIPFSKNSIDLSEIVANWLMLAGLSIAKLDYGESIVNFSCYYKKPRLHISLKKPFTLEVTRGVICTEADKLFQLMVRHNISNIPISAGQYLGFKDLSQVERAAISSQADRFIPWIETKIPSNCVVTFAGSIRMIAGTFRDLKKSDHSVIWLTASSGFNIIMDKT